MRENIVSNSGQGKTLETYLRQHYPIGFVRKLFRKNGVRVNGVRGKNEMILKKGDRLKFYFDFQKEAPVKKTTPAKDKSYEILFEDEGIYPHRFQ